MDFKKLKKDIEKITISEEMQNRIIENCHLELKKERNVVFMKKKISFKKSITVAVAFALCLCVSIAAVAASDAGVFKNITNWNGTVVGSYYDQASNEIEVCAKAVDDNLIVKATMLTQDVAPYSVVETYSIIDWQIVDMQGNVIVENENIALIENDDNVLEGSISLNNIDSGNYKLLVKSFIGESKADQPLEIKGSWECNFMF